MPPSTEGDNMRRGSRCFPSEVSFSTEEDSSSEVSFREVSSAEEVSFMCETERYNVVEESCDLLGRAMGTVTAPGDLFWI